VDGKGNDAAWKVISPIREFLVVNTLETPTEKTSLRLCYDDEFIYGLYECTDVDVFTLHTSRDANIWESDVVEVYFWPDPERPIYYEFEISPNNAVFDARYINTGSGHFLRWRQWNSRIETAASIQGTLNDPVDEDRGFVVEFAIPIVDFDEVNDGKPLSGQTWHFVGLRFNYSVNLSELEGAATSNDPNSNFHKFQGYATLTFE